MHQCGTQPCPMPALAGLYGLVANPTGLHNTVQLHISYPTYGKKGVTDSKDVNYDVSVLRTGRDSHCPALLGFVIEGCLALRFFFSF